MGENTKIEWCDHTFNPWRGCQKVAAGCANCYAEAQSKRNTGTLGVWGPNGTRVVAAESAWKQVEKWDRDRCPTCKGHGVVTSRSGSLADCSLAVDAGDCPTCGGDDEYRPSVFCGSMCDVFEDWTKIMRGYGGGFLHHANKWQRGDGRKYVEIDDIAIGQSRVTMSDVRGRVFNLIDATRLTWLLLTKRPENIRRFWMAREQSGTCVQDTELADRRRNVWLGTSIACQEDADRNIPELLKCRDLCRGVFLSIEPLLDDIDIRKWLTWALDIDESRPPGHFTRRITGIDQVIVGGESGPNARPCDIAWIRSIVRQCAYVGVPCFVKQWGSNPHYTNHQGDSHACGPFRDKKGGDPDEWPEDVRVRQLIWKGGA